MNPTLLACDTLSDRRDIWFALHKLPPALRVCFLKRACEMVPRAINGQLPAPMIHSMKTTLDEAYRSDDADIRLSNEIYMDIIGLAANWNLDLVKTAAELERWVRQRGV